MKAKKYLQQLRWLDTVINQKLKEIQDLRLKSQSTGGIDYSKERVQTSLSGDAAFVKLAMRIVDLEAEINAEIGRYVDEKHRIINEIQALKDADHISLLYKRYVEFKKFEVIAVEMNYTYRYVLNMHGYALKDFATTYKI